jgi:hypothetical protein
MHLWCRLVLRLRKILIKRAATVLRPEQDRAEHGRVRSRTEMAKTAQITLTEVARVVSRPSPRRAFLAAREVCPFTPLTGKRADELLEDRRGVYVGSVQQYFERYAVRVRVGWRLRPGLPGLADCLWSFPPLFAERLAEYSLAVVYTLVQANADCESRRTERGTG